MDLQIKALLTQVVGFLIVLWLLKKYAWDGLLKFIEHRRETIANEFETIETTKAEAEALRTQFETELSEIESTRRSRIQEAAQEALGLANDIKEEARQEAVELRVKTKQDIGLELDKANATLRDRMVSAVITTTEMLIKERLDSDKHKELINGFLNDVDLKESR
jgi:F-type H+-transporting ATPase subunit b